MNAFYFICAVFFASCAGSAAYNYDWGHAIFFGCVTAFVFVLRVAE